MTVAQTEVNGSLLIILEHVAQDDHGSSRTLADMMMLGVLILSSASNGTTGSPIAERRAERKPRDRERQIPRPLLPLRLLLLAVMLPRRRPAAAGLAPRITPRACGKVRSARLWLSGAVRTRRAPRAVSNANCRRGPAGDAVQVFVQRCVCCCATREWRRESSTAWLLLGLLLLGVVHCCASGVTSAAAAAGAQQRGAQNAVVVRAARQLQAEALAARVIDVCRHRAHQLHVRVRAVKRLCRRRCCRMLLHAGA